MQDFTKPTFYMGFTWLGYSTPFCVARYASYAEWTLRSFSEAEHDS